MAYEDKVVDITAEELENTIKVEVPQLREKQEYQDNIPVSFDAKLDNNICKVNCLFASGGSNELELDLGLNKSASFGDLTGATKNEVVFVRLEDSQETQLETYQSGGSVPAFRDIYIPVALYWTKENEIVGFCGYEQEEVYSELKKDLEVKADKRKFKPIRTFIVGDETTYRTHDIVTYLDNEATQIQKIVLTETDDNRPIKVKYMFARVYLPKRTDIASNYGVAFLPYGLISTDEDGFAKGTSGYKLCSSSESAKPANDNYSMVEVEFTDNFEYVFGRFTSYATSQDSYGGMRNWPKNPYYLNGDDDVWGNIIMEKLCNAFNFHVFTSGVALPNGAKVEIFGVEE